MSTGIIAGLVLAAGASRRMGSEVNKLREVVDGKPLVASPVDVMREAGVDPVFVVTGYEAEEIRRTLADRSCVFIDSPDWDAGMGASIAAGMRGVLEQSDPDGVLISVGDLAGLETAWIEGLIRRFSDANSSRAICVPTYGGRFGHPILFGRDHFDALTRLEGDVGGRSILQANEADVCEVETPSDAILRDLDSPVDFEAWRARDRGR